MTEINGHSAENVPVQPPRSAENAAVIQLTRKDFVSDQEVRWCPGCGDYSILAQTQKVMPDFGYARENIVLSHHVMDTLVLAGGVLRHPAASLHADAIARGVPDAVAVRASWEPAAGAVLLACDEAGFVPAPDRLRESLPADSFFATRSDL